MNKEPCNIIFSLCGGGMYECVLILHDNEAAGERKSLTVGRQSNDPNEFDETDGIN